jgi:AraC-like DNA-binding protein
MSALVQSGSFSDADEAVEKMADGDIPDWTRLALDLGYYDQAHLIKDFKSIVGKSPENYIKLLSERLPEREY